MDVDVEPGGVSLVGGEGQIGGGGERAKMCTRHCIVRSIVLSSCAMSVTLTKLIPQGVVNSPLRNLWRWGTAWRYEIAHLSCLDC